MTNHKFPKKSKGLLFFIITGVISAIWFFLRVIPKPDRISYPCQKVAAANTFAFLTWLAGTFISFRLFKKAGSKLKESGISSAAFLIVLALAVGISTILLTSLSEIQASIQRQTLAFTPEEGNQPIGEGAGIYPGRVVWASNPDAVTYDPTEDNGFWWENHNTDPVRVDEMFSDAIDGLSGATRNDDSWDALFRYKNIENGKGDVGYSPGEKISIKVNLLMGLAGGKEKYNRAGPTPQLLESVLSDLIFEVGIPPEKITVYDVSARIPDYIMDPFKNHETEAFHQINFVGNPGYIENERYSPAREDLGVPILWGDTTVSDVYLVKSVTEADYLINFTNLKTHNMAGVTLCTKNLYGSVYFPTATDLYTFGFGPNNKDEHSGLHKCAVVHDFEDGNVGSFPAREMGSYNYLVDIMGHPQFYSKTILYIVDAFYGASPQNQIIRFRNFGNNYTSSLFISQDPVAIESVCLDFLRTEPMCAKYVYGNVDNYLHEAALAGDPPSGVLYSPGGEDVPLSSLGVHEHWNNATEKLYSRNLGTGNGIELISIDYEENTGLVPTLYSSLDAYSYPNPFSSTATIQYELDLPASLRVDITDGQGRLIECLWNENQSPGKYSLNWNADDVPPGIYFCRFYAPEGMVKTLRLVKK